MQMVRLNVIKRNSPAGSKPVESLDERIRRIREENKKREQRHLEIEQDKKLASNSVKGRIGDTINKDFKRERVNMTKGVQQANSRITTKGRGQMLLEMSNRTLKAESFRTRMNHITQCVPENITLKNKSRSAIRERIKMRNEELAATVPVVGNNDIVVDTTCTQDTFHPTPVDQNTEISTGEIFKQENDITSEVVALEVNDEKSDTEKHERDVESSTDVINQAQNLEMDVSQEESKQKNEKPQITVKLKKTDSSSSFDEAMAMLSPLDLPQNWGDIDSDEDTPGPSIWKN